MKFFSYLDKDGKPVGQQLCNRHARDTWWLLPYLPEGYKIESEPVEVTEEHHKVCHCIICGATLEKPLGSQG